MRKQCKCKFDLDDTRTFESYCFEFCGLLNVHYSEIKFLINNKDIVMARTVKKACEILVFYNIQQKKAGGSSGIVSDHGLSSAYSSLFETGLYSDIEIVVNGEKLVAHKCILTARSEKFKTMLLSEATTEMIEQKSNRIEIESKEISAKIYNEMLRWLYVGECDISHLPSEVLPLLQLTDEYLLADL